TSPTPIAVACGVAAWRNDGRLIEANLAGVHTACRPRERRARCHHSCHLARFRAPDDDAIGIAPRDRADAMAGRSRIRRTSGESRSRSGSGFAFWRLFLPVALP